MELTSQHRGRWFVYAGNDLIPHVATMRGEWGYEVKCSCGWQTRTGGATKRYAAEKLDDHKREMRVA